MLEGAPHKRGKIVLRCGRVTKLPSCGIPLRTDDMLARNPDNVSPRASRVRRRTPRKFLRRRRKYVP